MSGKHIAKNQPPSFIFSEENKEKIKDILKKYPDNKKKKCRNAFVISRSKTK